MIRVRDVATTTLNPSPLLTMTSLLLTDQSCAFGFTARLSTLDLKELNTKRESRHACFFVGLLQKSGLSAG